jgi:hypothetical protein
MALSGTKVAIGAGVAVVAFLVSYGIASATESKPVAKNKVETKPGETIDIAPVKGIQKGLIILGYDVGPDGADDKYGANTAAGIKKFNAENGGPADGNINADLRKRLAVKLRAKGYTVVGDASASVYENVSKYSSGGGSYAGGSTTMTKTDAYNIGCKRGSSDGESEAKAGDEINSSWEVDKDDKTAYEAYTKFKDDFKAGYKDCYLKAYNKAKPWYEEGMTVTSTGRLIPEVSSGSWGSKNDILARANRARESVYVGRVIESTARKVGQKVGLVR